jgi:hypothetical protein
VIDNDTISLETLRIDVENLPIPTT